MHFPRLALLVVPLSLVAPGAACTSSSAPPAPNPAYADVIFQGAATEPALTAMLAVKPTDDAALAAYFDNPMDLSELPPTPIATFTWHDGQASAMQLLPAPTRRPSFTGHRGGDPQTPGPAGHDAAGVLAALFGEGTAHAGEPAMSGPGYLLVFSVLGGQELFRVFTSGTSYTPDAGSWAKIATGNWTDLQITSATFSGDALAANGGPYSGQEIKFCVGTWQ